VLDEFAKPMANLDYGRYLWRGQILEDPKSTLTHTLAFPELVRNAPQPFPVRDWLNVWEQGMLKKLV